MPTSTLATKLYVPAPRPQVILRTRLLDRLNAGLQRKLTLISAPAGFGKTTLVTEWITACQRPTAWLSLDEGDQDLTGFLAYVVAALRTIAPALGAEVLAALQSSQSTPAEAMLTVLINEIAALPDDFLLVLDDYHLTDSRPIDSALTFLLDHLPARMHLVITTREDPQLPIARLRARHQLTELRAADLRFTPDEAAAFLTQVMGLRLNAADISTLEARTEGWIAGLQLAALSLQGREDISGFLKAFTGDHRYIVDYLVEEVLKRQPESVRRFMLQTAILDRMSGPLCDAVTGQQGGSASLEALERGNLFVVPLDDQRLWFRYHHLFADVLHAHLLAEQSDQIPALHARASDWYEQHGLTDDAIRHALTARDFTRAAALIERVLPVMTRNRQEATLLGWLQALPDEIVRDRPVLSLYFAGTLLQNGHIEGVEAKLRFAEQWLDRDAQPDSAREEPAYVDEAEFRSVPASIAMYRSAIALISGDTEGTLHYARQVFERAPEDDLLRRASAAGLLGLAYWTRGELEAASRAYIESMTGLAHLGHISDVAGLAIGLASIQIVQGHLREAIRTYERALQRVTANDGTARRGAGDMHVGLSEVYREYNDLDAAMQHVQRSQELGELAGLPQNRYRQRVALARIREVQGDFSGALDLLDEAERVYASDFFPNVRPIAALKARIWAVQGALNKALDWARDQRLSVEDDLSYLHEFEHITLARILLAKQQVNPADAAADAIPGFLARLADAADRGARTGSLIEILVLQALTHHTRRDDAAALAALERALTLAAPEGYIRTFMDEGPPMVGLLEKASKHGIAPDYVRQLLRASARAGDPPFVKPALPDALSERELEVLRLLDTELDGPELARALTVSLNTIRTHTKNIYAKLGVNNRRAAVRRAEELGLL